MALLYEAAFIDSMYIDSMFDMFVPAPHRIYLYFQSFDAPHDRAFARPQREGTLQLMGAMQVALRGSDSFHAEQSLSNIHVVALWSSQLPRKHLTVDITCFRFTRP